jgi:hypothetical protein
MLWPSCIQPAYPTQCLFPNMSTSFYTWPQIGVMHVRSLFGAAGTELGSVKKERSNDKNPRKRGLATGTI